MTRRKSLHAFGLASAVKDGRFMKQGPDEKSLFPSFRSRGFKTAKEVYGVPLSLFGASHEKYAYDRIFSEGSFVFYDTRCNTRGNLEVVAKQVEKMDNSHVCLIAGSFQAPRAGEHGNEFELTLPIIPAEAVWLSALNMQATKDALARMRHSFGHSRLTEEFLDDFIEVGKEIASGIWRGYTKAHFGRYDVHTERLMETTRNSSERTVLMEHIVEKVFGECPLARRFVLELAGIADIRNGSYTPITA